MTFDQQIEGYLASRPELKRRDLRELHQSIQHLQPGCQLWFIDGRNDDGKIVSNPNIGYGFQEIPCAKGDMRPFYQVGLSANTGGISLYLMGIGDKLTLPLRFSIRLVKASVTGCCIKFRSLKDISVVVLREAIRVGFQGAARPSSQ